MVNNIFKISITMAILIVAFSIAYPIIHTTVLEQEKFDIVLTPTPTLFLSTSPSSMPTVSTNTANTLSLLNQCLDVAKTYKEDSTTKLLSWAKDNNQNGQINLTGAFDSINKKYEEDRQDCFAKYPQK